MPPTFLEKVVIFRFERRYPQKYTVAHLKSNILSPPNFLVPQKSLGWLRHCIAASPVKDVWGLQSHAEKRISHRNLKWTFQDSLLCYCYATKSNTRTMRSQVS